MANIVDWLRREKGRRIACLGDVVYLEDDPVHVATVIKIDWGVTAVVRWASTGWISHEDRKDLVVLTPYQRSRSRL